MEQENNFVYLGKAGSKPSKDLDTFTLPEDVRLSSVTFETNELTAFCPVTGQPDIYSVVIQYQPDRLGIESKSLKLYFWSYREESLFGEVLAHQIAKDIYGACNPFWVVVEITQQVRGGIILSAQAQIGRDRNGS